MDNQRTQMLHKMWRRAGQALVLMVPLVWLLMFLLAPFLLILGTSLGEQGAYGTFSPGLSLANFMQIADPLYSKVYFVTFSLAIGTTLACLLLAYPLAVVMATARPLLKTTLQVLTVVPFFANFIVRIQSMKWLLSIEGPMNALFIGSGLLKEPIVLVGTSGALAFGMIVNYLPSMVLPLYVALRDFDFELLDAAKDLGASRIYAITRVLWPLTIRGILAGSLLVFIPSLGEFLIPELLGGGRIMLLGSLITAQFVKWRHWPFGAALSVVMIVAACGAMVLSDWLGAAAKRSSPRLDP